MSSTNKTTNYELSQFVGPDKPAWLGDYNSDMSKIDTGIHTAQTTATGADGKADSANTNIGTLSSLTTTTKTDLVSSINEVNTSASTAQNTASTASNNASTALTKLTMLGDYLDISSETTPTISISGGTLYGTSSVTCASNNSGSFGKIFGWVRFTANSSTVTLTFPTPFRPTATKTFDGVVVSQLDEGIITERTISIATDGTATIQVANTTTDAVWRLDLIACDLFIKAFKDLPLPE